MVPAKRPNVYRNFFFSKRTDKSFSNLAHRSIAKLLTYSLVIMALVIATPAQRPGLPGERNPIATPADQPADANQPSDASRQISPDVARQIAALDDEKASRTPAQQKIDSQLLYAAKMFRGLEVARGVPTLEVDVNLEDDGRVVVDITTMVNGEILKAIKANGGEVLVTSPEYQTIQARLPITQLENIASLPQVRFIQPKQTYRTSQRMQRPELTPGTGEGNTDFMPRADRLLQRFYDSFNSVKPLPNGSLSIGSAASEGDTAHRAGAARGTFNVDGTGIKIGVLSNGVASLAASQTLGDLGTVTVLPGQAGTGDEGTAMLEIVHDLAPGAQLYFATGNTSITSFAQNIRDLRTAGCDIIVDDIGYFVESPFQDGAPGATNTNGGAVTQAVNDVVAAGALYFSSAANSGNKNDNTSTTFEGDYVSGGTLAIVPGGGTVMDFDSSAAVVQYNLITVGGGTGVPINLSWSDALGVSANDYDLFILNNAGTAVSVSSTNVQSGTQDPYEQVNTNNTTGRRVVIRQKTGAAARFVHLSLNGGLLTFSTPGETHGHNAASGGYGVAATPAFASFAFPPSLNVGPYPGLYSSASTVETFSSDGPRRIFYQGNGTAITPGNFSSTGGQLLQQPVIAAADGVQVTGVGGFSNPFFGTSAAAPHAAAIAALLKSANPSFTQAQIRTALTSTAIDIETAGVDRDAGYGIVMPYPALQSLGVTGRAFVELGSATAVETGLNNNGLIERGEVGTLTINLNNVGLLNATGITSTLTTTTPGVSIQTPSPSFANMAATSGTATNAAPIYFSLATNSAIDVVVDFTLTLNYTGGWNPSQVINFSIPTGRRPITTVLDTTAPTTSTSFPVALTGTQTNLLFPDDPAGSCAVSQPSPGTLSSTTPRYDQYTISNTTGVATCVTITITADKSALGAIQAVAYNGAFTPASPTTNYLADPGFIGIVYPGYPGVFSGTVPAGGTLNVVVVELKSPANGFPSALGSTYTLKVAGLPVSAAPTAAPGVVTGKVTANGRALGNTTVTMTDEQGQVRTNLTNSFGLFQFDDVQTGKTYVVQIGSKRYQFTPQVITVSSDLTQLVFEAESGFGGTSKR